MKLHTASLMVLLTQGNKSTAANPVLQITVCNAARKSSSTISFSLSSGFSPVLDDPFFQHTRCPLLRFRPQFPGFIPCFLVFMVFLTPLSKLGRILFLICMPHVEVWRFKFHQTLIGEPYAHMRTYAFPPLPTS